MDAMRSVKRRPKTVPNSLTAFILTVTMTAATSAHGGAHSGVENGLNVSFTDAVVAQGASPAQTSVMAHSYHDGFAQGERAGSNHPIGGALAGGLALGSLLGPIGMGIGFFTTRTAEPPASRLSLIDQKGDVFVRGYVDGYKQRAKSKARYAKLGGGLLGILVFLAPYLYY